MRYLIWAALGFGAGAYLVSLRGNRGGRPPAALALEEAGTGVIKGIALGTGFILANRLVDGLSEKKR
jgi:hypothetical protein